MCEPFTIAAATLAIGSTVVDHIGQNKASKTNRKEARIAEALQINDINLRSTQEKAAASQDIQGAERQTTTALSSARVSAGEAGVAGASVDALLADIGNEGSAFTQTVKLNTKNTLAQLQRQKLGVAAQTRSRINSVPKASLFATGLRIGATALDAASTIQSRKAPSGK